MACNWSAENATRAYLDTMKMGKRAIEPDAAEFISALAAGTNAQLMAVVAGGVAARSTTLALVAAAHQTGGRVVCILRGPEELRLTKHGLGPDATHVEFVIGEARYLLTNRYREADFVVIDCGLSDHDSLFRAVQAGERRNGNGATVLGYNTGVKKESWSWEEPIPREKGERESRSKQPKKTMGKDLSNDQVSSMREAFTLFDTDNDGKIAPSELGILMRSLGGNPTQAQLKSIVSDEALTSPFDFPRFLDLMSKHLKPEPFDRQLRDAFKVLDKEGTGYVVVSDLKHILTSIGEKLDAEEFDEWIREVDVGSDGRIRYEDFIARMVAK
ncbi:hypothetical protein RHMOL_Rhmol09G0252400 [Rhododendron molle]|uniref:Uncharacterized protein n=1 Tax=Rhododendron molle TaxID=49168 RepID=A0ACC0MGX9_RHOML|nr:hypothetical protein RHMOL_Rhmol09G0252400 [Rhododendron molle]